MSSANEVTLEIACGRLLGLASDGTACRFHGIPYAQPPVATLRFAPPLPVQPWSGVRDARRRGPIAPQRPSRLGTVLGDHLQDQREDCLTLTVWTPAPDKRRRPVIVWLHGGAFATGAGDLPWYDGARMAHAGDVVVVGVNYRLGALGFLRARGLTPGNLGLMDQELAIYWVREHIASFGGDPDQITLMGQSAGSLSIALLLARGTLPPVRRAIMMSAPLGLPLFRPEHAEQVGEAYVRALGLDPQAADLADSVRRRQESELMQAQGAAATFFMDRFVGPGDVSPPFIPVADGDYLPTPDQMPAALAAAAGRCDVLIGTVRDEAAAFFPETWDPAVTAKTFEQPSIEWARQAAAGGRRAHLYRLDWAPEGSPLGAAHCIDLPFVFDTVSAYGSAPMLAGARPIELNALSSTMRSVWTAYAHSGTPGRADLPAWPACASGETPRFHFDRVHRVVPVEP